MAKRRPIVDQDYSPVRSKLSAYRNSEKREAEAAAPEVAETKPVAPEAKTVPPPVAEAAPEPVAEPAPQPVPESPPVAQRRIEPAREPEVAAATDVVELTEKSFKTALTSELRARCTDEEHEQWHRFAQEVTGKRNNFTAVFRACLSLLEHATGELEQRKEDMKALKRPPKGQNLATALYEHQLGQILYDSIRAAGRPKDRVLARPEKE